MRFFLPHWHDKVNTHYDFVNEQFLDNNSSEKNESYIWDLYPKEEIPFDGLLISKINLQTKNGNANKTANGIIEQGIRNYLRFPDTMPLMGDCGAFSYIGEKDPPFDAIEILEFYYKMRFDLGVIVDHLIVPATYDQKEYRSKITFENAKIMYDEWEATKNIVNNLN